MEINGYALGPIVHMGSSGPLWATTDQEGNSALLSLYAPAEGAGLAERWKAWAYVKHPGIVRLLDVITHSDGRWALVQERVVGQSLSTLTAQGLPRTVSEKENIFHQLCAGVSALHKQGIIHGDIAPSNIIIETNGRAVLIDIADDPEQHYGTPGFSDKRSTGIEGDIASLNAIGELLGVTRSQYHHMSTTSLEQTGPEGNSSIAQSPASSEKLHDILRREAAKETTLKTETRMILGFPFIRHLRFGFLLAGSIVAICGACGGYLFVAKGGEHTVSADISDINSSCVTVNIKERVSEIFKQRDRALALRDSGILKNIVADTVYEHDHELLNTMRVGNQTVQGFSSILNNVRVVDCRNDAWEVEANIGHSSYQLCDAQGTCTMIEGGETHRTRLYLSGYPGVIYRVEALEEPFPGQ